MVNERLLKARMVENGYNDQSLSRAIGIDTSTFYRKKAGNSDFYRKEIQAIKDCLCLSGEDVDRIFFAKPLAEVQVNNDEDPA